MPTAIVLAWFVGCPEFQAQDSAKPAVSDRNVIFRGALDNCRLKFSREKVGHVAFIGGSITEMNGYRPMVYDLLQRRFPDTKFTFTAAGIASTCSMTGAMRLQDDVLKHGPVDLFFIEFAVNDTQDAHHSLERCVRGMEGVVRHTRKHNPRADMVITYFVNGVTMKGAVSGDDAPSVRGHRQVAEHYKVSTINLASEVGHQIEEGALTMKQFGGVHPAPFGNALCTMMIDHLFNKAWTAPISKEAKLQDHAQPELIDPFSYDQGRYIPHEQAKLAGDWRVELPEWKQISGRFRGTFAGRKCLVAEKPGSELTLNFSGRAIGLYLLAGPDAGIIEYQIDDQPVRKADLYHYHSRGLHYPRTVMLNDMLRQGAHSLRLKISSDKNEASKGTAARVLHITGN